MYFATRLAQSCLDGEVTAFDSGTDSGFFLEFQASWSWRGCLEYPRRLITQAAMTTEKDGAFLPRVLLPGLIEPDEIKPLVTSQTQVGGNCGVTQREKAVGFARGSKGYHRPTGLILSGPCPSYVVGEYYVYWYVVVLTAVAAEGRRRRNLHGAALCECAF